MNRQIIKLLAAGLEVIFLVLTAVGEYVGDEG